MNIICARYNSGWLQGLVGKVLRAVGVSANVQRSAHVVSILPEQYDTSTLQGLERFPVGGCS